MHLYVSYEDKNRYSACNTHFENSGDNYIDNCDCVIYPKGAPYLLKKKTIGL